MAPERQVEMVERVFFMYDDLSEGVLAAQQKHKDGVPTVVADDPVRRLLGWEPLSAGETHYIKLLTVQDGLQDAPEGIRELMETPEGQAQLLKLMFVRRCVPIAKVTEVTGWWEQALLELEKKQRQQKSNFWEQVEH